MTDQMPLGFDAELYGPAFGQFAGPIHWPSLTTHEKEGRSSELDHWVRQLVARFDIDVRLVPPCWQQHNGMVETLSALRDHERASYADTASPTAAVDWLRAFREVEARLFELASKTQCTAQAHRAAIARVWPDAIDDGKEARQVQPPVVRRHP